MAEYRHIFHTFLPVYDQESELLILGSFPSVKSREQGFYYGHPRNRFWKVISAFCGWEEPSSIEEKKQMLLKNHIAVWDVIDSCDIKGSSDSSIRNVVPADVAAIVGKTKISRIYANGKTAGKLYEKYLEPQIKMKARILPSTSPANAAFSLEDLIGCWKEALNSPEG